MDENTSRQAEERFFLETFNADSIFNTIERADYLFLYRIRTRAETSDRVYLSDLSTDMNLPMPALSKAIQRLQDKGLVSWKTDRSEGRSYVALTNKAIELMEGERSRMHACYARIREEIDPHDLEQAMQTMRQISEIMKSTV